MIKKQYYEFVTKTDKCYFHNFIDSTLNDDELKTALKKYNAQLGKSKGNSKFNVKWRCAKKYTLFVLQWS